MQAYKCDICKNYFEHYVTDFKNKDIKYFNQVTFHVHNRYDSHLTFDVCPNCMINLMKCAKIDNVKYDADCEKAPIDDQC